MDVCFAVQPMANHMWAIKCPKNCQKVLLYALSSVCEQSEDECHHRRMIISHLLFSGESRPIIQGGPKNKLFSGPQNFIKISVEKQTICQEFSELCLQFNNVLYTSRHYIYSLCNLHKLPCTSKSQRFDNVDTGDSLDSYSKFSKQDDNKHTEGWLIETKFNMSTLCLNNHHHRPVARKISVGGGSPQTVMIQSMQQVTKLKSVIRALCLNV